MKKIELKLFNIVVVKVFFLLLTVVLSSVSLKAQHNLYGLWARKAGVLGFDAKIRVERMQLDSQGNVYVAGYFMGPASLSDNTCDLINTGGHPFLDGRYTSYPHPNPALPPISGESLKYDAFVSKYNEEGKWEWTVTAGSEVVDNIADIVLTDNEQTLTFIVRYSNIGYSKMAGGTLKITYGNKISEPLDNSDPDPYQTFHKASLIKVNIADGSKVFNKYMGVGKDGATNCTDCFFYIARAKSGPSGNIIVMGSEGKPYKEQMWVYDSGGNFLHKKSALTTTGGIASIYAISKNATLNHFYAARLVLKTGQYEKSIVKYANASVMDTELAHTSNGSGIDYSKPGFTPYGMDVNNEDTHLFMAGSTYQEFIYLPTNTTIPFKGGGGDAFIACYNPQNPSSATNLRWLVQLGADGNEGIIDCQYHQATATLRVVGWIQDKEVDFNPRGTPMKKKGTNPGKNAMFYAVYNNNGICQSVTFLDQQITPAKMELAGDNVTVFGTTYESPVQVDPSGRLRPIRATGSGTFLAKYSNDPASVPLPIEPASFSASDNLLNTYGMATHDVQSCLRLGILNNLVAEELSLTYMPADFGSGVENPNYDGLTSIVVSANGKEITASVKVLNDKASPAYLVAWIDFNKDGAYDPNEASNVVTIPINTGTMTTPVQIDTLKWTNMPGGTVVNKSLDNLRIRLSSEQMDGTWSAGHAADGEVEDYAINIRLNSILKDDFIYTFACDSINMDVLANDDTLVNSQITLVAPHPSYITLKDGNIIYNNKAANCCDEGNTNIFVKYSVCNSVIAHCDTATLKVQILRCPQIILKDSCSFSPSLKITEQYPGASYQWQHSEDGTLWTDIALATGLSLDISQLKHEYYYKVKIVYGHSKATTEEHQFIIIKEINISNRTWYETSLQ